jgi:hypothetical protein
MTTCQTATAVTMHATAAIATHVRKDEVEQHDVTAGGAERVDRLAAAVSTMKSSARRFSARKGQRLATMRQPVFLQWRQCRTRR